MCRQQDWTKWTNPEGAQRGGTPGAAPKITLANVPPILASPPASNLIAFSGNVLTIPD
jgi:hydroxybutyrate-dimer hydrolase